MSMTEEEAERHIDNALAELQTDPWMKLRIKQEFLLSVKPFMVQKTRTMISDFHLALKAVDGLLAKYSAIKQDATGAKWRGQSPETHLEHAKLHAEGSQWWLRLLAGHPAAMERPSLGQEEDLLSTACRSLMALQLYLEQKAKA